MIVLYRSENKKASSDDGIPLFITASKIRRTFILDILIPLKLYSNGYLWSEYLFTYWIYGLSKIEASISKSILSFITE